MNNLTVQLTVTIRGLNGQETITCTQPLGPPDPDLPELEAAAVHAVRQIAEKAHEEADRG